ncbi:MAG: hypothetical protein IPI35_21605 [Deltaproteobacteria bacterium]|nr:hypothetical protein [Deltaproteobacteria bacterium]
MEAGTTSPTVPPNLDTPEGTIWRVDLPWDGSPVFSESVVYGEVPEGMVQIYPETGAPAELVAGREYYLYVTADILYPISRCVFVAGERERRGGCSSAESRPAGAMMGLLLGLALAARRRRLSR